jgi:hypothetical protein
MKKFLIDSFDGGISKYPFKGLPGAYQFGKNLNYRTDNNTLSCNQDFAQEGSGVIVDTIRFFVPSITGKLYGFGSAGKIYERATNGTWTLKYSEPDGEIRGATEWFCSNGKTYLFWATHTSLHQKEVPGNGGWSDVDANIVVGSNTYTYPKTNLSNVSYHTMSIVMGNLYIANGEKLAMVGYDGSYTNEALRIFKNEHIKTIDENGSYLVFGTERQDNQEVSSFYLWDTVSLSWNYKKVISNRNVNGLVFTDIPIAQIGTDGQLFYADMQTPLPIRKIPGGGYVRPGGVAVDENKALFGIFGNSDGNNGIYSYGRINKDENHTLNLEYYIGTCDEIGALCNLNGLTFVSYRNGSSYYVRRTNSSAKVNGTYYSLELRPDKDFIAQHLWRTVNVHLKSLPSGTSISCQYRIDKGSWKDAKLENGSTSYSTTNGKQAIFFVGDQGNIFEFALTLTSSSNSSPEIEVIEVYFD